jgi:hypothetical protein
MGMAEVTDGDSGDKIDVTSALGIQERASLTFDYHDGKSFVGFGNDTVGLIDNLFFHAAVL